MREPLEHIIRPQIPWRQAPAKTECGRGADAVEGGSIGFEEFRRKFREYGQQRTAMTTCMTCYGRATTGATLREDWAHNPAAVFARDIGGYSYDGVEPLNTELRALELLVKAHPEEFAGYLAGLAETLSLDRAREQRRRR